MVYQITSSDAGRWDDSSRRTNVAVARQGNTTSPTRH
jgi:CDP-glycerol glycerophosphotransferase (TagB/SpsB family)